MVSIVLVPVAFIEFQKKDVFWIIMDLKGIPFKIDL